MKGYVRKTLQNFKDLFWYFFTDSLLEDAKKSILKDESFLRDIKNGCRATIHLRKKHLSSTTTQFINKILSDCCYEYEVTSVTYHFHGMSVVVSRK